MKGVSLFSGVGGMDLGAERAGIDVILQVEIDEYCRRVLAKHWPDVRRINDVRDVTAADCRGADIIFGGFPCQPVSVAGKRKGREDDRWLWPEFARLIREVRPRYVVLENVPGLISSGLIWDVLGDLSACGYDAEWSLVSAAEMGAPHLRERVFIVAYANCVRCCAVLRGAEGIEPGKPTCDESASCRCSLADANCERWADTQRGTGSPESNRRPITGANDGGFGLSGWCAQCGVRRMADGFSTRLDRPDHWAGGEWTGVPRIATGIPNRASRLKGLGNAVVPAVAEAVFRMVMRHATVEGE